MLHSQFKNIGLQPFVGKLDIEYYEPIEKLCQVAKKQAAKLHDLEVHQATSQYVSLCNKLIEEVENYVKFRKDQLIPYIQKLYEKDTTGHDCSKCTGNCNLQHDLRLTELEDSLMHMKDTLSRLQMVSLPLYSDTIYPDVYRILRNQMALIENALTDLFSLEETALIPKVKDAQKNIHVHS